MKELYRSSWPKGLEKSIGRSWRPLRLLLLEGSEVLDEADEDELEWLCSREDDESDDDDDEGCKGRLDVEEDGHGNKTRADGRAADILG